MPGQIKGIVFDIMKFAVHDGPGIRTAVFLKGCPLRCLWCHNPESTQLLPEISFVASKCTGCGSCLKTCPNGCHKFTPQGHLFDRSKCARCGLCTKECYSRALEVIGREMDVPEVIDEVMKDKAFYESSGGGITLSGGEPMFQFDFAIALLKEAKARGLHVCMETCGFASIERYSETLPYVDVFLFDIKESDPDRHMAYTGASIDPILRSLEYLDSQNAKIILRCPIIPGLNARESHLKAIGALASRLEAVLQVDVEPYHPLGMSKSDRIGKVYALSDLKDFPEKSVVAQWVDSIKSASSKPVFQS